MTATTEAALVADNHKLKTKLRVAAAEIQDLDGKKRQLGEEVARGKHIIDQQKTTIAELQNVDGMRLREKERAEKAEAECHRLRGVIEADRQEVHQAVTAVLADLNGREWLTESRGPYEWDDDRYMSEAGAAVRAVREGLVPLGLLAHNMEDTPTDSDSVRAARNKRALQGILLARPYREYHEDKGPALWWRVGPGNEICEPPYIGSPLDTEWPFEISDHDGVEYCNAQWTELKPEYIPKLCKDEPPEPERCGDEDLIHMDLDALQAANERLDNASALIARSVSPQSADQHRADLELLRGQLKRTNDLRPLPEARLDLGRRCWTFCQQIDGACEWKGCPQLRDGEPVSTGRHCPLDQILPKDDDHG